MTVQTYLFFDGRCEEAIRFYGDVFGAELRYLLRFKDGPPEVIVPGSEDLIFHATVTFGETALNMSDAPGPERVAFDGFALLTHLEDVDEAERVFGALRVEGDVRMPLQKVFWATRYGIVKDRFGVTWKVQVS